MNGCCAPPETDLQTRIHVRDLSTKQLIFFKKKCILCIWVFRLHVCLWATHVPGARVTDGCELPHGFWGKNECPLQEWSVLLTSELSL